MKRPLKTPRIIEIEWSDSCSTHGWFSQAETAEEARVIRMKTIGYFVRRTKRDIAVAQTVSEHGKFSEVWTIPAPWRVHIRAVRTPKR